jgi:hypothetical protein
MKNGGKSHPAKLLVISEAEDAMGESFRRLRLNSQLGMSAGAPELTRKGELKLLNCETP